MKNNNLSEQMIIQKVISKKMIRGLIKTGGALFALFFMAGCVMTPNGIYTPPPVAVDGTVGVDANFAPRVHVGTRSSVSVWLHPNYVVADAFPLAQQHCSRWGLFASPLRNWDISVTTERYLNYNCISVRPVLAFPHVIVDHNRWYRRPWHRRWYRRHYGTRYRYRRPIRNRGPIINDRPRTIPRKSPSPVRRGWWSRPGRRGTERGKPWDHNRNKRGIVNPTPIQTERGKPWEHNRNKRGVLNRNTTIKTGSSWRNNNTTTRREVSRPRSNKKITKKTWVSKKPLGGSWPTTRFKKSTKKVVTPKKTLTKKTILKSNGKNGEKKVIKTTNRRVEKNRFSTKNPVKSIGRKKSAKKKSFKRGTYEI